LSLFGKIFQIDVSDKAGVPLRCNKVLAHGQLSDFKDLCPEFYAARVKMMAMGIRNPGGLKFVNTGLTGGLNVMFADVGQDQVE